MLRLLLLLVAFIYLGADYKKNKGHVKAKVIHCVLLAYLVFYYSTAFAYVSGLLRNGEHIIAQYQTAIGLLSSDLNLIIWVGQLITTCLLSYCAFGLVVRKEKSRNLLLKVLPFAFIFDSLGAYRDFVIAGDEGLNHYAILIVCAIIIGGINVVIFYSYKSKTLIDFFMLRPGEDKNR